MPPVMGTNGSDFINLFNGATLGADTIWALDGDDTIWAFGGNDQLKGGGGADAINGGSGSDTALYIDSGVAVSVSLLTGLGAGGTAQGDTLTSIENLSGSNYNDLLIGDGGSNTLSGVNGNDTLKGGGGADNLDGGAGTDTADYTQSATGVVVSLIVSWASGGDAQGDTFTNIESLTGSAYADLLAGTDGANTLSGMGGDDALKGFGGNDSLLGGAGADELFGDDGNDSLNGGTGVDTMEGGAGNDTYYVDDADDELSEGGGEGSDTVLASVNYALAEGVDVETLATTSANGTADLVLYGNSSGNSIIGNNGDNILKGGGGTDQLTGRSGNDIYYVDDSDDSIVEFGGQGTDEVWASGNYTLTAGADVEVLRTTGDLGVAAIRLTGNSSGNVVRGNAGNNILNGGDGNDELTGLGGQDAFSFSTALNAATNVDVITDFNVTDDTIRLDALIFGSLDLGFVAASEFVIGAAAQDADDYLIYNSATGDLYYDSDGNGEAAATQFAELSPGLALTNLDFFALLPS